MTTHTSNWLPPIPLGGHELKPFPNDVFPEPFNSFVEELARSTETPRELAALLMLPVVATAIQKRYIVQVKEDHFEHINLWTSVCLPSGSRKSKVQVECTRPLFDWEHKQKGLIEPQQKILLSKNKNIEMQIKQLRNPNSSSKDENMAELNERVLALEESIEEIPKIPQLWTSDVTAENLAIIIAENNEAMSILSDEAGIFDIFAGRYSGGVPNLDLILKGHTGTPCRVNRSSKPPIMLQRPLISIGLCPQPEILESLSKNKTFRGRGLLARFLYAVPPSNLGKRSLDAAPMNSEVREEYHTAVHALLELGNTDLFSESSFAKLTLEPEADQMWQQYALVVEVRMGIDGLYSQINDWASKFPGAIARIAALIHIMRYWSEQPEMFPISLHDMKSAIAIGSCLANHALFAFDLMGDDFGKSGARKILEWIKKEMLLEFTQRDCHYKFKSYFNKVKELEPCFEVLIEHNFIRERVSEKVSHRPSRRFEVNPWIFEDKKET